MLSHHDVGGGGRGTIDAPDLGATAGGVSVMTESAPPSATRASPRSSACWYNSATPAFHEMQLAQRRPILASSARMTGSFKVHGIFSR